MKKNPLLLFLGIGAALLIILNWKKVSAFMGSTPTGSNTNTPSGGTGTGSNSGGTSGGSGTGTPSNPTTPIPPAAGTNLNTLLTVGMAHPDVNVTQLQKYLNHGWGANLVVDGWFGTNTKNALMNATKTRVPPNGKESIALYEFYHFDYLPKINSNNAGTGNSNAFGFGSIKDMLGL